MTELTEERVWPGIVDSDASNGDDKRLDTHHHTPSMESPFKHTSAAPNVKEKEVPIAESPQEKGETPSDTIDQLVALFREFLETTPNIKTVHNTQSTPARKKLFGLTKALSPEMGSNNPFDYEQKYPRDRHGQELAGNARVWLTYLDEAGAYDRDKVEGWKDTVDVLLVFAGLFSGVITTFVSQASQSLQQNYTQVSASLLFQMAQVQLAQFTGTPITIPNSTLIPTSPFIPSTNAALVNGLWFTSLAVSLTTAFFAVLTKQWLYYYMSAVPGTALDKVRVRQFRFQGLELWKVGLIVDLLPVLLHLALGVFLLGVIIFLFPLDIRIAWTTVAITSMTYILYFISVILPIRYPDCPYTTSLTLYLGSVFYFLSAIFRKLGSIFTRILHRETVWYWRITIREKILRPISRLLQHPYSRIESALRGLVAVAWLGIQAIRHNLTGLMSAGRSINWREENLNKYIQANAVYLDCKAFSWLYAISSNPSVRRIIARGASVHPALTGEIRPILGGLQWTLDVNETNLQDLCYGLYMDLPSGYVSHWNLLKSITSNLDGSQLNEIEYQNFSRISVDIRRGNYDQIMQEALNHDLKFRLVVWYHFFAEVSVDDTLVAHILTSKINPFYWDCDPARKPTYDTDIVPFGTEEQYRWIFDYLFRCFQCDADGIEPNYSSESRFFETRYLLFVSIYQNLTSNRPIVVDGEQKEKSLERLFRNFVRWLYLSKPRNISLKHYSAFFKDILCVDAFRNKPMTGHARWNAIQCLDKIWYGVETRMASHFPFLECQDLSPIYKWGSRDLSQDPLHIGSSSPIVLLLFMPQNRAHLLTTLSADPDAASHLSQCLKELRYNRDQRIQRNYVSPNLMHLFKSIRPTMPLFTVLYDTLVLVQAWRFLAYTDQSAVVKEFLRMVKSKLDQEKLETLHAGMVKEAQSEWSEYRRDVRFMIYTGSDKLKQAHRKYLDELNTSLNEFGRSIGTAKLKPEFIIGENPASEGIAERDGDIEACLQEPNENERESSYPMDSITHRIKKAFTSVWPTVRQSRTNV